MIRINVIVPHPGDLVILSERLNLYASRTDDFEPFCSQVADTGERTDCFACPTDHLSTIPERLARLRPTIAYGPASGIRGAFLAGCVDFLKDPWTPEELHFRALQCSPTRLHRFFFGTLQLDNDLLRLGFDDDDPPRRADVAINPKQSAIMKALLSLRGNVVDRNALYYSMWGRSGGDSRALDMQVHAMRNHLGRVDPRLAGNGLIRSVYAAGYVIE